MAKLDMKKALAGAVTPLNSAKPSGEPAPELRIVEQPPPASDAVADAVDETVLNTDDVDAQSSASTSQTVAADTKASASPRPQPARKMSANKPAPRPVSAPAPAVTAMQVEVDQALDARLVAYRLSTRLSFHQIILDAVEHTYPDLTELVAKSLGREEDAAPRVRLFERTFVAPQISVEGKKERAAHTIRITLSNRSMLDDIAVQVKAPSRNYMICVALDNYLPA